MGLAHTRLHRHVEDRLRVPFRAQNRTIRLLLPHSPAQPPLARACEPIVRQTSFGQRVAFRAAEARAALYIWKNGGFVMAGSSERHTEFFGPDLGRGPFSSQRIETSALQIAAALAQIRAPLAHTDDDLRSHVAFIRELANNLAPDYATTVKASVGAEAADTIQTTINAGVSGVSMLDIWLADTSGGGRTTTTPASVSVSTGTILMTLDANRYFRVLTSSAGLLVVNVTYLGARDWYWGISRLGLATYSTKLHFV